MPMSSCMYSKQTDGRTLNDRQDVRMTGSRSSRSQTSSSNIQLNAKELATNLMGGTKLSPAFPTTNQSVPDSSFQDGRERRVISSASIPPAAGGATASPASASKRAVRRTNYKHVPHREKPAHLVARRNARERKRVQAVNAAFLRLRRHLPYGNKNKRLSKVKTLRIAIDYIFNLKQQLDKLDYVDSDVTAIYRMTSQQQEQEQEQREEQDEHEHYNARRHSQQIRFDGSGMFQHADMIIHDADGEWKIHDAAYRLRS